MMVGASNRRANTLSNGPVFDLDVVFPEMKTYLPSTMLPTIASVVGMLRSILSIMFITIIILIVMFIVMI